MIYNSRKDTLISLILWGTSLLLIGASIYNFLDTGVNVETIVVSSISMLTVGLVLWIWFNTYYKIAENTLFYRSGPIAGRIEIEKIREISPNKTMYAGLKPALASKGLIIRYEKYNDIYISPAHPEAFINELLKVNPSIVVVH